MMICGVLRGNGKQAIDRLINSTLFYVNIIVISSSTNTLLSIMVTINTLHHHTYIHTSTYFILTSDIDLPIYIHSTITIIFCLLNNFEMIILIIPSVLNLFREILNLQ